MRDGPRLSRGRRVSVRSHATRCLAAWLASEGLFDRRGQRIIISVDVVYRSLQPSRFASFSPSCSPGRHNDCLHAFSPGHLTLLIACPRDRRLAGMSSSDVAMAPEFPTHVVGTRFGTSVVGRAGPVSRPPIIMGCLLIAITQRVLEQQSRQRTDRPAITLRRSLQSGPPPAMSATHHSGSPRYAANLGASRR